MKHYFSLLTCVFLGGCSVLSSERTPCSKTAILAEFSKTVVVEKDSSIRTEMDSLRPTCTEDDGYTFLDMRLRVTSFRPLVAYHHPLKIAPSYFVAVIDKEGTILSRTNHEVVVTFEEKQTTKVTMERIQEKIPVGKDVTVYVGFNLDEAQVDYFRKVREKKGQ